MAECEVHENPEQLKYTTQHLWLEQQAGDVWKLGITEFAQDQLGDLVYVTLPSLGEVYSEGAIVAVLESVKSATEITLPFTGTVTMINQELADRPELINQEPYEGGWLFSVSPKQQTDMQQFLSAADYDALLDA
ncbi:glycine cleavage system protein H [Methylophaga lonarensis MPL]|uniref:Glycine cleavage system H protein n=1 Tax=Methylophaga lonarensis MPL TaxID=1286106 RepID=M7NUE6_9GAMM|nr:glycine cleavage system protein H [Methylophaga lonarensis MPL]